MADDGTQYVGYCVKKYNSKEYVNTTKISSLTASSSGAVPNLFVVDKSTYLSESANGGKVTSGQNAYCFNKGKHEPYNQDDGTWVEGSTEHDWLCLYNKVSNATADQFAAMADKETLSPEQFRNQIISIGLNGYPNDYSGFNTAADGTKLLADDQFKVMTQWAIWHYTDGWNPYSQANTTISGNEKIVYDKLISSMLPSSILAAGVSGIDLYEYTGSSSSEDTYNYQNLLTVYSNYEAPAKRTLTLTKAVTGGGADSSQQFEFTITLTNTDADSTPKTDYWLNTYGSTTITSSENGVIKAKLKAGDTLEIEMPDEDYKYEITETSATFYTPSYSVTENDSTVSSEGATVSGTSTKLEDNAIVACTNTYSKPTTATLEISKDVVDGTADEAFAFEINITNGGDDYTVENGTKTDTGVTASLKNGESVKISGLSFGYDYTVKEVNVPYYYKTYLGSSTDELANRTTSESNVGSATDSVKKVTFTNKNVLSTTSDIEIAKKISEDSETVDPDAEYGFKVVLKDTDYAGNITNSNGDIIGSVKDGEGTFKIKADDVATIKNVLPEMEYTIQETDLKGCKLNTVIYEEFDKTDANQTSLGNPVDLEAPSNTVSGKTAAADAPTIQNYIFENIKYTEKTDNSGGGADPGNENDKSGKNTVTKTAASSETSTGDTILPIVMLVLLAVAAAGIISVLVARRRRA
jgi:TQXA domain-containing protein